MLLTAIPTPATRAQFLEALKTLEQFIGPDQLACVRAGARGEERQFFYDKMVELAGVVSTMPRTYEQDGKGDQAIVSLHYFAGGRANWHITEKDAETPEEPGQHQACGQADLGYGPELGYISIVELVACGAELDYHFKPCTLAEVNAR